jgi:hypothetical protein
MSHAPASSSTTPAAFGSRRAARDAAPVHLAPAITRGAWALIWLVHLAIIPLAVSSLPSGLPASDLAQFVVARVLGMTGFVSGGWLLVALFDRIQGIGRAGWRVLARIVVIHGVAALQLAVLIPILLLVEAAMGWSAPRSVDDYTTQFEVNVVVFLCYAGGYWAWRRQVIARTLSARAAEAASAMQEARLHALALELQPHFLYNTLNGIVQLVHEEPARAEAMLVTLSDLLRTTVQQGRVLEHPLADEEALLALYLELQGMRFGDRLRVVWELADEARSALVPPMLLQPLVENALHHGIGRKPGPGTLTVRASPHGPLSARSLRLQVVDDGIGLATPSIREGTGLRNARERLQLLYADAAQLTVAPNPGGGVAVTVDVPWRPSAGDRANVRDA